MFRGCSPRVCLQQFPLQYVLPGAPSINAALREYCALSHDSDADPTIDQAVKWVEELEAKARCEFHVWSIKPVAWRLDKVIHDPLTIMQGGWNLGLRTKRQEVTQQNLLKVIRPGVPSYKHQKPHKFDNVDELLEDVLKEAALVHTARGAQSTRLTRPKEHEVKGAAFQTEILPGNFKEMLPERFMVFAYLYHYESPSFVVPGYFDWLVQHMCSAHLDSPKSMHKTAVFCILNANYAKMLRARATVLAGLGEENGLRIDQFVVRKPDFIKKTFERSSTAMFFLMLTACKNKACQDLPKVSHDEGSHYDNLQYALDHEVYSYDRETLILDMPEDRDVATADSHDKWLVGNEYLGFWVLRGLLSRMFADGEDLPELFLDLTPHEVDSKGYFCFGSLACYSLMLPLRVLHVPDIGCQLQATTDPVFESVMSTALGLYPMMRWQKLKWVLDLCRLTEHQPGFDARMMVAVVWSAAGQFANPHDMDKFPNLKLLTEGHNRPDGWDERTAANNLKGYGNTFEIKVCEQKGFNGEKVGKGAYATQTIREGQVLGDFVGTLVPRYMDLSDALKGKEHYHGDTLNFGDCPYLQGNTHTHTTTRHYLLRCLFPRHL